MTILAAESTNSINLSIIHPCEDCPLGTTKALFIAYFIIPVHQVCEVSSRELNATSPLIYPAIREAGAK